MVCPSEDVIGEFVARALPSTTVAQVEVHLASCDECRNLVFALASGEGGTVDDATPATAIGRFVIEGVLGRGAMGVVYRARDPELERAVAVKVRLAGAKLDVEGEDRLRREAQALAKLTHPNVVGVYEAGQHGASTYVAMELVEGPTLDRWLDSRPAPSAILDVMAGAGRGLAAAHAVGLVHRDFKPRNVFVATADQIAKVGDFGLVRVEQHADGPGVASELLVTLSVCGSIIGTPAYMAPEQLRGAPASEASDQFSFCVTLYEALYGKRPFVGTTLDELAAATDAALVIPPAPRVSRHVQAVLRRGLDRDPARRFPSMTELLAALDPPARRGRWAIAGAMGGAVTLAAVSIAMASSGRGGASCDVDDPTAARVFAPDRLAEVKAALVSTGARTADATADRVVQAFAAYGTRWQDASRTICEATVEERQSPELADLQRACLERRLQQADELASTLAALKDPAGVAQATSAVLALADVESCTRADAAQLSRGEPPPADKVDAVAKVERTLDAIASVYKTGQVTAAAAQIDAAIAEARATGHAGTLARALLVQATIQAGASKYDGVEAILDEAAREAAKARDDRAAAEAWTRRVYAVGVHFARYDDAHQWARAADAAVLRAGNSPDLRSGLHMNVGTLLIEQGKLDEARVEIEAAIALRTRHMPHAATLIGDGHNNLAALLQRQGKMDEAQVEFEKAIALYRGVHGDEHPDVVEATLNLGFLYADRELHAKALETLTRARSLAETVLGPTHMHVGIANDTMGLAKVGLGEYDEALALHRKAHEVMLAAVGPTHPRTAFALANIARVQQRLGDFPAGVAAYRESLAILEETLGPKHALVARIHGNLGNLLTLTGDLRGAREEMKASLAVHAAGGAGDGVDASLVRLNLAMLDLQEGRAALARPALATAYAALDKAAGPAFPHTLVAHAGLVFCDVVQRTPDAARLAALEAALATAKLDELEPHTRGFISYALARAYARTDKPRAREHAAAAIADYDAAKIDTRKDAIIAWRDKELR